MDIPGLCEVCYLEIRYNYHVFNTFLKMRIMKMAVSDSIRTITVYHLLPKNPTLRLIISLTIKRIVLPGEEIASRRLRISNKSRHKIMDIQGFIGPILSNIIVPILVCLWNFSMVDWLRVIRS